MMLDKEHALLIFNELFQGDTIYFFLNPNCPFN